MGEEQHISTSQLVWRGHYPTVSKESERSNRNVERYGTYVQIQKSFFSPIASKFLPLLVVLSRSTVTESRLISFSEGLGEPSIQPFQPFLTAIRFLRCFIWRGIEENVLTLRLRLRLLPRPARSSSSNGVCRRLDELRDVLDEIEGPGVFGGDDGMGGGVTETERCTEDMCMAGLACQNDDGLFATRGTGAARFVTVFVATGAFELELATGRGFSTTLGNALAGF